MKSNRILFFGALGASLIFTAGCAKGEVGSSPAGPMAANAQQATITVDNGFSPPTLNVKAGQPVEITFDTKHHGCANAVVFKDLGITKALKDGEKTVVSFTPAKPGTIGFACDMNMLKGQVEVQ